MATTTTRNGFRVEDVTFRGARQQSAILDEIGENEETETGEIKVPVSLTPEQVKSFFEAKSDATNNGKEKKLYAQTIRWIDELLETKKKLIATEEKLETYIRVNKENSEETEDI